MNKEIKPCPFCGGKAELIKIKDSYSSNPSTVKSEWMITCSECGIKGRTYQSEIFENQYGDVVIQKNGAAEAIEVWNRRVES